MLTRWRVTTDGLHPEGAWPSHENASYKTRGAQLPQGRPHSGRPFFAFRFPFTLGVVLTAGIAVAGTAVAPPLWATGSELEDDSAVMIGSDGVVYSLNIDTAVATAGDTLSGDTFGYGVTGLEADPTTNTLYAINQSGDANVLASIDYSSGISTLIESDYGPDEVLDALDRTEDGTFYLAHVPDLDGVSAHLSTLSITDGTYTEIGTTDLAGGGGGNQYVSALVSVADALYGFVLGGTDGLYQLDTDTAEISLAQSASDAMAGVTIVAADSTADDTVYLLGREIDNSLSLYTNDLAGTSTLVGAITGVPIGVDAGNFAIATLLESERVEDDTEESSGDDSGGSEPGGSGGGEREPEDSDGVDTVLTSPLPPANGLPTAELAPTGPVAALGLGGTLVGLSLGTGVGLLIGLGLTAGLARPGGFGHTQRGTHPRAQSERP